MNLIISLVILFSIGLIFEILSLRIQRKLRKGNFSNISDLDEIEKWIKSNIEKIVKARISRKEYRAEMEDLTVFFSKGFSKLAKPKGKVSYITFESIKIFHIVPYENMIKEISLECIFSFFTDYDPKSPISDDKHFFTEYWKAVCLCPGIWEVSEYDF